MIRFRSMKVRRRMHDVKTVPAEKDGPFDGLGPPRHGRVGQGAAQRQAHAPLDPGELVVDIEAVPGVDRDIQARSRQQRIGYLAPSRGSGRLADDLLQHGEIPQILGAQDGHIPAEHTRVCAAPQAQLRIDRREEILRVAEARIANGRPGD